LTAAREGLPLYLEAGYAWNLIDHLAPRAALAGNFACAARLADFADSTHRNRGASREPNEARASARLQALLQKEFAAVELQHLLDEGAELSESEACRLALEK
jgi:hypothetical protein